MSIPWWGWALVAWVPIAFAVGWLLGLMIREADRRDRRDRAVPEEEERRGPLEL